MKTSRSEREVGTTNCEFKETMGRSPQARQGDFNPESDPKANERRSSGGENGYPGNNLADHGQQRRCGRTQADAARDRTGPRDSLAPAQRYARHRRTEKADGTDDQEGRDRF